MACQEYQRDDRWAEERETMSPVEWDEDGFEPDDGSESAVLLVRML